MKKQQGEIIKFYRELKNLTQKELGEGVCSTTHISKIERGLTDVSMDIIETLTDRLGIDMKSEFHNYSELETKLKKWHDSIILKLETRIESLKEQLNGIALLKLPEFYRSYTLILTRYYLSKGEEKLAKSLIREMECWAGLTPYEKNMLLHIKGIYNLQYKNDEHSKTISLLKEIDLNHYNNPEYHYHLALAYHSIRSRVLSYYHASKALLFFTESQSLSRMIETEMLMLIQVEQDEFYDPKDNQYQRLIYMAENYGLEHLHSKLIHNYGFHQLRYGQYEEACKFYRQSMETKGPLSPYYLGSLEGYLEALTKQGKTSNEELLQLAEQGISLAEKKQDITYSHFFRLHRYKLKAQEDQYFHYLETEAYPYFKEMGYVILSEHYQMKLFGYYMERGEMEKANSYAKSIVGRLYKDDQFV
ncbi:helix-turn-helix domain-containing protein [Rossellomorea sp. BNER]|uniref:helix-turn-helix domain-containing protein n=1 Tax=Rossellomorea sp. BNER TaxID=2962031 RepID=UPI003AF289DE|nr:helix-turn-helix transcriptional regulator [Rossellomorea sp. BNER]